MAELVALLDTEDVPAVITARDWFTMADSQVDRRLAADRQSAFANIHRVYRAGKC